MPVAWLNRMCWGISWPWSQVRVLVNAAGRVVILAAKASATKSALWPSGQRDQYYEPGRPLHQGRHRAHLFAEDQVTFPMSWDRPVICLGGALGDVEDPRPATTAIGQPGALRTPDHPPGPQMSGQLPASCASGLDEQGAVDRLVRHLHLQVVGVGGLQPAGDPLR